MCSPFLSRNWKWAIVLERVARFLDDGRSFYTYVATKRSLSSGIPRFHEPLFATWPENWSICAGFGIGSGLWNDDARKYDFPSSAATVPGLQ